MMPAKWPCQLLLTVIATVVTVGVASAQAVVPPHSLQGLLDELASKVNVVGAIGNPAPPEGDRNIVGVLTSLEVSTAPLGTSTGGFTFVFDSKLGTFTRSTETFGPAFGKRSLTIGKGKVSAGFNWLHANYDTIAGLSLSNGDLRPVKNVRDAETGAPLAPFDSSSAVLDITSDTFVGSVTYGLTNDLDVGVAVPWVRIGLAADVSLLLGSSGEDFTPGGHPFVIRQTSSTGVGDIAVFGKYRFWHHGDGGFATEIEVRLPSGSITELRGLGTTRTSVSGIWSYGGRVSPHASVGYEFWADRVGSEAEYVKNQFTYALGLEIKAHSRATAIVDVIGRKMLHGGTLAYESESDGIVALEALVEQPRGLHAISFAPGIKWNVAGSVLLTSSVLASIANDGLRARVIPVVGFEWAF
jgi:hypothetical protein